MRAVGCIFLLLLNFARGGEVVLDLHYNPFKLHEAIKQSFGALEALKSQLGLQFPSCETDCQRVSKRVIEIQMERGKKTTGKILVETIKKMNPIF